MIGIPQVKDIPGLAQILRDYEDNIPSMPDVGRFIGDLWKAGDTQLVPVPKGLRMQIANQISTCVIDYRKIFVASGGKVDTEPKHHLIDRADAVQAGGDHYKKMAVQPWHAMEAWLTPEEWRGFLKGNIIKYLARANSGKEDHDVMIEKAGHYLQKLTEFLARNKAGKSS